MESDSKLRGKSPSSQRTILLDRSADPVRWVLAALQPGWGSQPLCVSHFCCPLLRCYISKGSTAPRKYDQNGDGGNGDHEGKHGDHGGNGEHGGFIESGHIGSAAPCRSYLSRRCTSTVSKLLLRSGDAK